MNSFIVLSILVSSPFHPCEKSTSSLVAAWQRVVNPQRQFLTSDMTSALPTGGQRGVWAWKYSVNTGVPADSLADADGKSVAAAKCSRQGSDDYQPFFPEYISNGGCTIITRVTGNSYRAFAIHFDQDGNIDGVYEGIGNVVNQIGRCEPQPIKAPATAVHKPAKCTNAFCE